MEEVFKRGSFETYVDDEEFLIVKVDPLEIQLGLSPNAVRFECCFDIDDEISTENQYLAVNCLNESTFVQFSLPEDCPEVCIARYYLATGVGLSEDFLFKSLRVFAGQVKVAIRDHDKWALITEQIGY